MSITLAVIAVTIGISLGLIGAGGAIVAVPAFVYIGGIDPNLAAGYALFVVSIASLVAVGMQARQKLIEWTTIAWFGPPAILSLIAMRGFLVDFISERIQMLLFGLVLLGAAGAMLRPRSAPETPSKTRPQLLAVYGLVIGALGGLLGVGGGFLITPALVLWAGLDMKRAVASSLVLICLNSMTGVIVDMAKGLTYDWSLVMIFTGLTTLGIVTGTLLSRRINGAVLKASFGWVVLAIGLYVMSKELL